MHSSVFCSVISRKLKRTSPDIYPAVDAGVEAVTAAAVCDISELL